MGWRMGAVRIPRHLRSLHDLQIVDQGRRRMNAGDVDAAVHVALTRQTSMASQKYLNYRSSLIVAHTHEHRRHDGHDDEDCDQELQRIGHDSPRPPQSQTHSCHDDHQCDGHRCNLAYDCLHLNHSMMRMTDLMMINDDDDFH